MRRSASMNRSALGLSFPLIYTNSSVGLYAWPAASTLNMAAGSSISFVRKYMISVLVSEYDEAKHHAHDHDHAHHIPQLLEQLRDESSIVGIKHAPKRRHRGWLTGGCFPRPTAPVFVPRFTKAFMMPLSALKRV